MLEQTLKNTRQGSLPGNGYGGFCIAAIQHPSPGSIIMKYCGTCGKELIRKLKRNGQIETFKEVNKRKYCNQSCFGKSQIKDNPSLTTIINKIRKTRKREYCEWCGESNITKLVNHHIDHNRSNNNESNLMTLCFSCHTNYHWKIAAIEDERTGYCIICGKRRFAINMCYRHYGRFKKYRDPFLLLKRQDDYYTYKLMRDYTDISDISTQMNILTSIIKYCKNTRTNVKFNSV